MRSDAPEFEAFVAEHYASLVRAARIIADDRSSAEDLVQAALIRTFAHWSSLGSPLAAPRYARTVLVRLAARNRHRRWRKERPSAALPERVEPDVFAETDAADALHRALAVIPVEQRAVLVLRYYFDLPEADIARVLRCAPGTVKSRANRGLTALRSSGLLGVPDELEAADG